MMNRAERRKKGISREDLQTITEHNMSTGYDAGFNDGMKFAKEKTVDFTTKYYSIAVMWVMYKKMSYGESKCKTTMGQIQNVFKDLIAGTLDEKAMLEEMEKEILISFDAEPEQP